MMNVVKIDVLLPCYKPNNGWEEIVLKRFSTLTTQFPTCSFGLIIVNDGSDEISFLDSIFQIKNVISEVKFVILNKNMGKGYALREGLKISDANIVMYTDIDWPYSDDSISRLLEEVVSKKCNISAGSRDDNYYTNYTSDRKLVSVGLRTLIKRFLKLKVSDTQCGLKAFDEKGKNIFLKTTINRFLFDLEFVFLASNDSNLNINPVKVELRDGVRFSRLKWRILTHEAFNFIKIIFKHIFK